MSTPIKVTRLPQRLVPDTARVIARLFKPGDEQRLRGIIGRIMCIEEDSAQAMLAAVRHDFENKHHDIDRILSDHFAAVAGLIPDIDPLSDARRQLIGAYFTMEYAIESAALFNPSIVPSHNQDGLTPGSSRFVMSLRATGEGHISSIVFRSGIINANCEIAIDPPSPVSRPLRVVENRSFEHKLYELKLIEIGGYSPVADTVLDKLGATFTMHELSAAIEQARSETDAIGAFQETAEIMLALARANYHLELPTDALVSEVVIFPSSENESNGIEDVRLVLFTDDDGTQTYYGTYTAYDGHRIFPQLLEIGDFRTVKIHTLSGQNAQNKGMALFPRRVDGWYMMVSRIDNENLYLMRSDNVRFWNKAELLQAPRYPWEIIQIGNCGSPIETRDGWLLLTHGVGPMRQYCMGATLLDLEDPSKIIGQTPEPLLVPIEDERDGYVPNVVYSCGAMVHHEHLVIPYAMSDFATGFATVPVEELLEHLKA